MKGNGSLRSWQTPNWVKSLVCINMSAQPHHLCSSNHLGFHRNLQALRGSRKGSVTKENSNSLVWDLEYAFGVLWILGFWVLVLFESSYLFCLGALWEILSVWSETLATVVLCLLSYHLMAWLALCCFVHIENFLFVIWVLCNLKLVEVIHANAPAPTIRGFSLRAITYLRSIFALDIVLVSVWEWAIGPWSPQRVH